jgi:hypothetical protein
MGYCPATKVCPIFATGALGAVAPAANDASYAKYVKLAETAAQYSFAPYFVIGVTKAGAVVEKTFTDRDDAASLFDNAVDSPSVIAPNLGYLALFYKADASDYPDAPYGRVDERYYGGGTTTKWDVTAKLPWAVAAAAILGVAYYYGKPRAGASRKKR